LPSAVRSAFGAADVEMDGLFAVWLMSTPPVSPETRLIAPGEDGPKVVSNELSLIA
jgi:hypothetical protein